MAASSHEVSTHSWQLDADRCDDREPPKEAFSWRDGLASQVQTIAVGYAHHF